MPARRLWLLTAAVLVAMAGYMLLGAKAPWSFLLPFRGTKLAALVLVGTAISTATVLFQTITQNRILTPSIMGFDALYILILTCAVYLLGTVTVVHIPDEVIYLVNVTLLIAASLTLFGTLLAQARADLLRMILTGIVFGVLFRSLTGILQRMIDPNEFSFVQLSSYARFNQIDENLLGISALATGIALAGAWRMRHRLDVLALGHDTAVTLGEPPRRGQIHALILIAVLVSVSTALVGPVAFLGLLVVSLARLIVPTARHAVLLPAAGLISVLTLVGGQTLLERVLGLATPLSVVVDVLGGLVFLLLLLKGSRP